MKVLTISFLFFSGIVFSQNAPNTKAIMVKKQGMVNFESLREKNDVTPAVAEMPKQGPEKKENKNTLAFTFKKQATVNFDELSQDFHPTLLIKEMPKQRAEKIETYNYPQKKAEARANTTVLPVLIKGQSFIGNPWGLSTPNDNDMAISDSGVVVSVINTNIFIRNTKTNVNSPVKSLDVFTSPINNKHQEFDPKVMYDPKSDRFVLVCLVGFVDTTSKVIIGFSQTNDPKGNWNLYSLPGNPLNDSLWTDYPMISMTEKELFLSVNLLKNNSTWQAGFVQTLIWQIKKENGYTGQSLTTLLHQNIKHNGKPIRNLCPVKGGSKLYSPNMYFLSNRNFASQNDTVFLVNVTDTIGSPNNTVTVKPLVTNQPYYFPPDGRQPIATESLATNDARNLGAFYENNKIQYVHNTNNPANNHVSVYYGVIDNPQSANPVATGYIIPNDTMDFAYPNISYAGNANINTAIIGFNHSSNKIFPGSSAVAVDGVGNFSPILRIQNGSTYVNLLQGGLERWGDYTGSQRVYGNNLGEVWMSGYYGYFYSNANGTYRAHAAWISQIFATDINGVGIKEPQKDNNSAMVYPNPVKDIFSVEINLVQPEYLSFELIDSQGKLVELLLRDWVKVKQNVFSFSTASLNKGIYYLKISGTNKTSIIKKVVKN